MSARRSLPGTLPKRAEAVLDACRRQGLHIATVESCTGGMVAAALTSIAGSSDVVECGYITYSNESKTALVGVPVAVIAQHGAVSEPVARAMAEGAAARPRVDIAVSITGIAGPGGGSKAKPVGLVHLACARKGRDTLHARHVFKGNREAVRRAASLAALEMIHTQAMRGRLPVSLPGRPPPKTVIGVDFSGAMDAGNKTWIAQGVIEGDGVRIEACFPARDLPESGVARDRALPALADYIAGSTDAIVGLDFPFGIPAALVRARSWERFILGFARRYSSADAFLEVCRAATGGEEPKRLTDVAARTPFSPINLRLYRQTYEGIAELLYPLVREQTAAILPMQKPARGKPLVIEACPASTLKAEDLYFSYKGRSAENRIARTAILSALVQRGHLHPIPPKIEVEALSSPTADALDSLVAAVAAFRSLYDPRLIDRPDGQEALEGRVFF